MIIAILIGIGTLLIPLLTGGIFRRSMPALPLTISTTFIASMFTFGLASLLARFWDFAYGLIAVTVLVTMSSVLAHVIIGWISPPVASATSYRQIDNLLCLSAPLVHLIVWITGTGDRAVVPNHDGIFHSSYISNMSFHHSLSPNWVVANAIGPSATQNRYPFGLHAWTSAIDQLAGVRPSTAFLAVTFILVVVAWPMSLYLLGRLLVPDSRLLPTAVALSSVAIFNFPYATLGWGGVPMVAGLILLVMCVCLMGQALGGRNAHLLVLAVVAFLALTTTHTSEVILLPAFFFILFGKEFWNAGIGIGLRITFVLFGFFVTVFPFAERLVGLDLFASLGSVNPNEAGALYQAAGQSLLLSPGINMHSWWVIVFVLGGIYCIAASQTAVRVLLLYAMTFALTLIASFAGRPGYAFFSQGLAPWYRQYQRMSYFIVVPVTIMGGVFLTSVANLVWSLGRGTGRSLIQRHSQRWEIVVAASVLLSFACTAWQRTSAVQKILFGNYSTQSWNSIDAPSSESFPDVTTNILASFEAGIGYWWIDHRVQTVAAPWQESDVVALRDLALQGVAFAAANASVRDALQTLNSQFVASSIRSLNGPAQPNPIEMESSRNFDKVWTDGEVTVWSPKSVQTAIVENATSWYEDPAGNRKWLTSTQSRLHIHNFSETRQDRQFRFRIYQNKCASAQSVTIDGDKKLFLDDGFVEFDFPIGLAPDINQVRDISVSGTSCLDEPTGQTFYVAVGEVESIPI